MAKKKNANTLIGFLPLVLAVVAVIVFLVMNAITVGDEAETVHTGMQVLFGYKETSKILGNEVTTQYLSFSVMTLIALLAIVAGGVLPTMNNKLFTLIAAAACIVGGVLLFMVPQFVVFNTENILINAVYEGNIHLGIGSIIGGIVACVAGLANLYIVTQK
ncbi:MAG: hypothetical protein IJW82_01730 [Clostridia bacterium]|nr:hypothetical protein [Clostridia bacterium]